MERITEYKRLLEEEQNRPIPVELTWLESRVKAKASQQKPIRKKKTMLAVLSLCLVLGTAMAWGLGGFEQIVHLMGSDVQQLQPYYQSMDLSVELEHARVDVEGVVFTTHSSIVLFKMTALDEIGRSQLSDHHAVLPFWRLMEGDVGPLEEPFDSFMEPYHEERDLQAHIAWDEWIEGNSADSAYCLLTIRVDKPLVEEENQTLLLYFDKAVDGEPENNEKPGGRLLSIPVEAVLNEKKFQIQDGSAFCTISVSPALIAIETALSGTEHVRNLPIFEEDPELVLLYQDGTRWTLDGERLLGREGRPPYVSMVADNGCIYLLYFIKQAPPDLENLKGIKLNGIFYPV